MSSYRQQVKKTRINPVTSNASPEFKGAADNVTTQLKQGSFQSISNIANMSKKIFENEMQEEAKLKGTEKAQTDFVEISALMKSRDELVNQERFTTADGVEFSYAKNGMAVGTDGAYIDDENENNVSVSDVDTAASITDYNTKIDTLLKQKNHFNISENSRAQKLNKLYLQKVEMDVNATIDDAFLKNKNNPEAFEKEAEKTKMYANMGPAQYVSDINQMIDNKIKTTKRKAEANLKIQQDDEITAVRNKTIKMKTNETSSLSFDGETVLAQESKQNVRKMLDEQVTDGLITRVQRGTYLNEMDVDITKQSALGGFDRLYKKAGDPATKYNQLIMYADNFLKKNHPSLDQDQETAIYKQMHTKAKVFSQTYKANISVNNKSQGDYLKKVLTRMKNGDRIGSMDIEFGKSIAIKRGETAKYNIAVNRYNAVNLFRKQPLTAQYDYLETERAKLFVKDAKSGELKAIDGGTLEEQITFDALEKMYQKNLKDSKDDPIKFISENPQDFGNGLYAPTNLKKLDSNISKDENGKEIFNNYTASVMFELSDRFSRKAYYKNSTGYYKTLSVEENALISRRYEHMDRAEKAQFMSGLTDAVGFNEASNVLGDIWKNKPTSSLIAANFYAKGSEKNIGISDDILKGQELKINKLFAMDTDTKEEFNELVMEKLNIAGYAISPKNLAVMRDSISDLYAGRKGNPETVDSAELQDAFDDVTGKVISYQGRMVFSPAEGIDEDGMEDWIDEMSDGGNDFMDRNYELPLNYTDMADFKSDLNNEKFFFESTGNGSYILRSKGNAFDYIKTKGGKHYTIDYFMEDPVNERNPKKHVRN